MLAKKIFRFINGVALFAMLFASLAPSISHALSVQNNQNSFTQEICNSSGDKIVIQVLTSKGKQLSTELLTEKSPPKTVNLHLEHCPFCSNTSGALGLPSFNTQIIALLEKSAQQIARFHTPIIVSRYYQLPPSQAPPHLL